MFGWTLHGEANELTPTQFNLVLDDTDVLLDDLHEWKRPDLITDPPPQMTIETYIDSSQLTSNQSLVLIDNAGKRWDCADALASSTGSSPRPTAIEDMTFICSPCAAF